MGRTEITAVSRFNACAVGEPLSYGRLLLGFASAGLQLCSRSVKIHMFWREVATKIAEILDGMTSA
jgi:hypothetical protein